MRGRKKKVRLWGGLLLLLWLCPLSAAWAAAEALRIVSANLCADRLLLSLVERERVLAVSQFAAEPALSTVVRQAQGVPSNQGDLEELVALRPDLVLLGALQASTTGKMLQQMGIAVFIVAQAETLEQVRHGMRTLAQRLGAQARAEALLADMDRRLQALAQQAARRTHTVRAVVYQAGGWSSGQGTLSDALFNHLHIRNVAGDLQGFGALPLENLVAANPDWIIVESMVEEGNSIAGELLRHPVLKRSGMRFVHIPMRLWACPDTALVDAAELMSGQISEAVKK
ncbi:MAG: ABC transporter substrate-binding protein [Magnetococcales bacterium]|nr:ABC transporter substrate-binding protein [Magnetococcales bacterium]MBF0114243.1 ABC transporter substrate-binding protein [Magnetococcales bacterium]